MIALRTLALLAASTAALSLTSGCALLSNPDPVQTYRFGGDPASRTAVLNAPVQVQLRRIEFPQAARGDKVLGVTGSEAAYIKGARWITPAEQLYADSLTTAFAGASSRVRLIGRRELTPATGLLDVDVLAFEARYDAPETVPTIVVSARARMLSFPSRTLTAEEVFTVSQPAGENRIASIVAAFDAATDELNSRIVAWTDQNVTPAARP